jgi:hypothetical protein
MSRGYIMWGGGGMCLQSSATSDLLGFHCCMEKFGAPFKNCIVLIPPTVILCIMALKEKLHKFQLCT